MLAADLVVFNSDYHRDEWFTALPRFLARLPDHRHSGLVDDVEARSIVLPVGAELHVLDEVDRTEHDRPLVLWNQRWEYDKGPIEFAAAIEQLVADGVDFAVALAGERPGDDPVELRRLRDVLGDRLIHDGYAHVDEYRHLLRRSDIVVSTAHHEFFGVAITEAIYAGAFPVLPNRLVYPERIPSRYHDACLYDSAADLAERLAWAIGHRAERQRVVDDLRPVMARCDWSEVAPRYDEAATVRARGRP
jgi:glycosyltransferase involved in cell wall biosynthesis